MTADPSPLSARPADGRSGVVGRLTHGDVRELRGPLLVVGDADGVGWDEFAVVEVRDGEVASGTGSCWRWTTTS